MTFVQVSTVYSLHTHTKSIVVVKTTISIGNFKIIIENIIKYYSKEERNINTLYFLSFAFYVLTFNFTPCVHIGHHTAGFRMYNNMYV